MSDNQKKTYVIGFGRNTRKTGLIGPRRHVLTRNLHKHETSTVNVTPQKYRYVVTLQFATIFVSDFPILGLFGGLLYMTDAEM